MQKPKPYPAQTVFAVRFNEGVSGVPDGSIKEMIELRPALAALPANPQNGFPGSSAVPAEECPKGYVRKTGAELNAIVDSIWPELEQTLEMKERAAEKEFEEQQSDAEVMNRIRDGFEWPAESGQRFSLSMPAQMNMNRYAARVAQMSALAASNMQANLADNIEPFVAGNGVKILAADFLLFYEHANAAIEKALADGRQRKSQR